MTKETTSEKARRGTVAPIKLREKLAYGLGDVACNVIWGAVTGFVTYYYTNAVEMAAAAIGTMFLISRILDGVSDIIMGLIIDRTRSKYGKARPWVLWMAIPFGISGILLFSVPVSWGPIAKLIYVYVTYNLLSTIVYTAINLAYGTMTALITDDVKDRTSLNVFRMVGSLLCGIVINVITIPMVNGFGGDAAAWQKTFFILCSVSTVLFLICFAGTKERVGASTKKEDVIPVKVALKALFRNKYWINRVIGTVLLQISMTSISVNVYYAAYWLKDEGMVGLLSIGFMLPMFIALFFMAPLAAKIGNRNICLVGSIITTFGMILQLFGPANVTLIVLGQAIRGLGMAPLSAVGYVMVADVIDYGEWKCGVRTEGLVYSASSFGQKVGAGLGAAMLGWTLAIGGFDAMAATQSPATLQAILVIFVYIPIVIQIISIILLWIYKLEEEMPQIRTDLTARKVAAESEIQGRKDE